MYNGECFKVEPITIIICHYTMLLSATCLY